MSFIKIHDIWEIDQKKLKLLKNKILNKVTDTYRVIDYKKELKKQQNDEIHQKALHFYIKQDPSFYILDRLRRNTQCSTRQSERAYSFQYQTQSPDIQNISLFDSLPSRDSSAVRNYKRKVKSSKRNSRAKTMSAFQYTTKQYNNFVI